MGRSSLFQFCWHFQKKSKSLNIFSPKIYRITVLKYEQKELMEKWYNLEDSIFDKNRSLADIVLAEHLSNLNSGSRTDQVRWQSSIILCQAHLGPDEMKFQRCPVKTQLDFWFSSKNETDMIMTIPEPPRNGH